MYTDHSNHSPGTLLLGFRVKIHGLRFCGASFYQICGMVVTAIWFVMPALLQWSQSCIYDADYYTCCCGLLLSVFLCFDFSEICLYHCRHKQHKVICIFCRYSNCLSFISSLYTRTVDSPSDWHGLTRVFHGRQTVINRYSMGHASCSTSCCCSRSISLLFVKF